MRNEGKDDADVLDTIGAAARSFASDTSKTSEVFVHLERLAAILADTRSGRHDLLEFEAICDALGDLAEIARRMLGAQADGAR